MRSGNWDSIDEINQVETSYYLTLQLALINAADTGLRSF
jgi:hypothetical protein